MIHPPIPSIDVADPRIHP